MSMMQILGAFAKNLLEEDEISRQGMMREPKEPEKRSRRKKSTPKAITVIKRYPKNEDVTRIANKVTRSIACHIDRMVKKRQGGNISYATPLGYEVSPFHNVNNPFWSQPRRRKSLICHKKACCPSCLRSFSSGKVPKNKSLTKIKKGKKKDEETTKKVKDKKVKNPTKKEPVTAVERPLIKTHSENLVQQPKTIWAKELLQEFREKVAKSDETAQSGSEREQLKIVEKNKEQEKQFKARKLAKPKTIIRKVTEAKAVQAK